jgi:2-polyprenyl-3-methyl-5-hydroxy-6-metoxy-1,4-benzoquinol methylase
MTPPLPQITGQQTKLSMRKRGDDGGANGRSASSPIQANTEPAGQVVTLDQAIAKLLWFYRDNPWFCQTYWPEHGGRIRRMITALVQSIPPSGERAVLDVGCYNGFLSFLLGQLGYCVTGTDQVELPDRPALLAQVRGRFVHANFNDLSPFPTMPPESFDGVVMGEVLEHVLNHPLGFLRAVAHLMKPGGVLVLTTPNPGNVVSAVRLLLDKPVALGADEFVNLPKVDEQNRVISHGGIHYHEYGKAELQVLLRKAGFEPVRHGFICGGTTSGQHFVKRFLKLVRRPLSSFRTFGMTHCVVARRLDRSDS